MPLPKQLHFQTRLIKFDGETEDQIHDTIDNAFIHYELKCLEEMKNRKNGVWGVYQFIDLYAKTAKTARLLIHTKFNKMQDLY